MSPRPPAPAPLPAARADCRLLQSGALESSTEELSQCSSRDAVDAPGCLFGVSVRAAGAGAWLQLTVCSVQGEGAWRRRGDVVVRTCHVLELATKLFLVVQNAVGAPPHVNINSE